MAYDIHELYDATVPNEGRQNQKIKNIQQWVFANSHLPKYQSAGTLLE